MGVPITKPKNIREQTNRSRQIDRQMMREKELEKTRIKLLLLGTAESGKSTILKQMKILHAQGFSALEREHEKLIIRDNIIQSLSLIMRDMNSCCVDFANPIHQSEIRLILDASKSASIDLSSMSYSFHGPLMDAVRSVWADSNLQKHFENMLHYSCMPESLNYFMDNFDRIGAPGYEPTEQDILRSRRTTTGVIEVKFTIRELTTTVIDVGGQRSERRKWIHCFECVNGVIFMAPLSEYNQSLSEDHKINRMIESMQLFRVICNSTWFLKSSIILFLNKTDVFAEKILQYPITLAFPDYPGPQEYHESLAYIQSKFLDTRENETKMVYTHRTCATDTDNVQKVFEACWDILIRANLARTGFV